MSYSTAITGKQNVICGQGPCAGKCNGEVVVAHFGSKTAKTVRIEPCSILKAQGWVGNVASAYNKNDFASLSQILMA